MLSSGRFELGLGVRGVLGADTRAHPELVPPMMRSIDEGARDARRDPSEVCRLVNVSGKIVDGDATDVLVGPPEHWVETLTGFAQELGFDTFVLWQNDEPVEQLERFAGEVVPALR